jgi:hypothetical protein
VLTSLLTAILALWQETGEGEMEEDSLGSLNPHKKAEVGRINADDVLVTDGLIPCVLAMLAGGSRLCESDALKQGSAEITYLTGSALLEALLRSRCQDLLILRRGEVSCEALSSVCGNAVSEELYMAALNGVQLVAHAGKNRASDEILERLNSLLDVIQVLN